jgi:predicted dehydrogenase
MRVAVFGTGGWAAVRLETRVREASPAVASCGRSDALL